MKKTMLGFALAGSLLAACDTKEQRNLHGKVDSYFDQVTETLRQPIIEYHTGDAVLTTDQCNEKEKDIFNKWVENIPDSVKNGVLFKIDPYGDLVIAEDTAKRVEVYKYY